MELILQLSLLILASRTCTAITFSPAFSLRWLHLKAFKEAKILRGSCVIGVNRPFFQDLMKILWNGLVWHILLWSRMLGWDKSSLKGTFWEAAKWSLTITAEDHFPPTTTKGCGCSFFFNPGCFGFDLFSQSSCSLWLSCLSMLDVFVLLGH